MQFASWFYSLRHLCKADSAGDWRYLQNCVAHFKQVRSLLSDGGDLQLEGPTVEVDETYMGGVRKGRTGRPMRGDTKKTPA